MCLNRDKTRSQVVPSGSADAIRLAAERAIARTTAASSADVLLASSEGPDEDSTAAAQRCSLVKILYVLFCSVLTVFYTLPAGLSTVMSGLVFFLEISENKTEDALPAALNRTFHLPESTVSAWASWLGILLWIAVVAVFRALFHFINIYQGISFLKSRFDYSRVEGYRFFAFFLLAALVSAAAGGMPAYVNLAGLMMLSYGLNTTISGGWVLSMTVIAWTTSVIGNACYILMKSPGVIAFLGRLFGKGYPAILRDYREEGDYSRLMDLKAGRLPDRCYPRLTQAIMMYVVVAFFTGWGYWTAYRVKGFLAPVRALNMLADGGYDIDVFNQTADGFLLLFDGIIGNASQSYGAYGGFLETIATWNFLLHFLRYNVLIVSIIITSLTSLNCLKKNACLESFLIGLMFCVVMGVMGLPDLGSVTEGIRQSEESWTDYVGLLAWVIVAATDNTAKLAIPMLAVLEKIMKSERPQAVSSLHAVTIYKNSASEGEEEYRRLEGSASGSPGQT